jgi:hypothetical protein
MTDRHGRIRVSAIDPVDFGAISIHAAKPDFLALRVLADSTRQLLRQVIPALDCPTQVVRNITVLEPQRMESLAAHTPTERMSAMGIPERPELFKLASKRTDNESFL